MAQSIDRLILRAKIDPQLRTRDLYGHQAWVDDLDIVNELGGHSGCVNALSWSRSGRYLATGSDDTYLNIWSYNPDGLAQPFTLSASVSTGHRANIFGVKFAPHSNDRTVITCAGDSQVRIFDIEHDGRSAPGSNAPRDPDHTRSRRFQNFFANAKFLNDGNTNSRVYRSHGDRVKRIVTESSPHTFLTCSEDGEVRQWDLRQPSSTYPPPRHRTAIGASPGITLDADRAPPPLISYKRFSLDLNSISCAPSQPFYIALGGAHAHCFLHDRRMLGRDLAAERGQQTPSSTGGSRHDDEMDKATRCVRRFAPNDKYAMGTHDNGHITACKISDANPNEMIASWSGDHIYSFDIVQSPDARDASQRKDQTLCEGWLKNRQGRRDRKRKRAQKASSTNLNEPAQRRRATEPLGWESTGQSPDPHTSLFTAAHQDGLRVAKSLVQLRKTIFDFRRPIQDPEMGDSEHLTPHTVTFTSVLGQAAALLPELDEIIRGWSYPMNPTPENVTNQNVLRRNRQAARRFVQGAGCIATTLGGKIQTLSSAPDPRLVMFEEIEPAQREGTAIDRNQRFCYDFLKAILLWLRLDRPAVVKAFRRRTEEFLDSPRFPLGDNDDVEEIPQKLVPYLLELASPEKPIFNVDASEFETNESRTVFESQVAAVNAWARVCTGFKLSGRETEIEVDDPSRPSLDFGAAARFWGLKVGRSLLMEASEGVNFEFVSRAFGGLMDLSETVSDVDDETVDDNAPEEELPDRPASSDSGINLDLGDGVRIQLSRPDPSGEAGEDEDEDDEDDDFDPTQSSSERQDSDEEGRFLYRRAGLGGSRARSRVEMDKPYQSHTRVYKGHCNVKTVKDVNFYGLDDEYVVSGSDSGHLFIWDRKTSTLLNILEADGEIVNVVTGHPYEPMIAASGIDSSVKIFSPDARAQEDARDGVNIATPPDSTASHPSLRGPRRRSRPVPTEGGTARGLASRRAMHRIYEITSQNDLSRQDGVGDAYVTRGMLARLAAHIQTQGGIGPDGTMLVDDQCLVM